MKKREVDEKRLTSFVLIPEGNYSSLKKKKSSLSDDHAIQVCFPYERQFSQVVLRVVLRQCKGIISPAC